jgi:hypothetical protein
MSELDKRQAAKSKRGKPEVRQPLNEDSTLRDSLAKYAEALEAKAEKRSAATLEKSLGSICEAMNTLSAMTSRPLDPIPRREFSSGLREATAVFGLSDVHCEERVREGETPVSNVYDLSIAERSIARFFAGARWHIDLYRQKFHIRDACLWLGGDLMSGHIHEELKENTELPPIETLLWLRPRIVAGIDLLLADPGLVKISIPCSYGNHGRTTTKSFRALGATHSYEWLLYQWIASLYEGNPRVQFLADQSAHQYVQIYDYWNHFHHGDETNYQGGIGGITIPINKASSQWDKAKRCDYHHYGHWHQYTPGNRITINGSVIGFNAYAMSIKAEPEAPAQFFHLIDSKRGKTAQSPIWVRATEDIPIGAPQ